MTDAPFATVCEAGLTVPWPAEVTEMVNEAVGPAIDIADQNNMPAHRTSAAHTDFSDRSDPISRLNPQRTEMWRGRYVFIDAPARGISLYESILPETFLNPRLMDRDVNLGKCPVD